MKKTYINLTFLLFLALFAIQTSMSQNVPELLYYRFENRTGTTTPNFASPGAGNNPVSLLGHSFGNGGQFDSCMVGTGGNGFTNYLNTGWAPNLGTGNWTISLWLNNIAEINPGSAVYLFGDSTAGQFRCFYGGAASDGNILLRGNSFADVLISNVMPGPTVIHIVYNGSNIIVYKNGSLFNTFPRSGINLTGAGPFKIGGYGRITGSNSINTGGRIDEFRFYNRALDAAEVAATWNLELGIIPSITVCKSNINLSIPDNGGYVYDTILVNAIPPAACITSLSVKIDTLLHPNDGDLIIHLIHDSKDVRLVNRAGGGGDNFIGTYIADMGTCNIGTGGCNTSPFSGIFKPSTGDSLSRFITHTAGGDYILAIRDSSAGQTGVLRKWCITVNYQICTGITGNVTTPSNYLLKQNYPNPFNPATKISYELKKNSNVKLVLYDINGREVSTLINKTQDAGVYDYTFNGESYSSGVYFYKLTAGDFTDTKKMVLIK
jgi:subtilisin-like proprotein convertase family protein